jgi:transcription elongation factor Elf1
MTLSVSQARNILDPFLGPPTNHRKTGEVSYHCPFCNHYKKKLQVNLMTQKWHCWVCDAKGQTVSSLLRKSNAPFEVVKKARELYGDSGRVYTNTQDISRQLASLPEGYKPLYINAGTPDYKNALHYAMSVRKLTPIDILRYQMGYCEEGPYAGMLVIPSYNQDNTLNYYVGRSYYNQSTISHKNPPVSKDVVGFENQINWKEPVTIVEGVFDAIAVKRNAIPLFGKKILPNLRTKILTEKVTQIYLALDEDAFADSVKEIEYFLNNGIQVSFISLPGKDPSTVGYEGMIKVLSQAKPVDFFDLIKLKMQL